MKFARIVSLLLVVAFAALAALVLAHRDEFQSRFARRDAWRVERLFQVIKETAHPLGDPLRIRGQIWIARPTKTKRYVALKM